MRVTLLEPTWETWADLLHPLQRPNLVQIGLSVLGSVLRGRLSPIWGGSGEKSLQKHAHSWSASRGHASAHAPACARAAGERKRWFYSKWA